MDDKPILFSAPMVQALLDGRKTQTRRVLKPQPGENATVERAGRGWWVWDWEGLGFGSEDQRELPKITVAKGDRLWVREAHAIVGNVDPGYVLYRANGYESECERYGFDQSYPSESDVRWRPSIHMPRWANRLTLVVTDVRIQRLQDISETDARAEGVEEVSAQWPPNEEDGFEGAPYPSFADYGKNANGCFSGYGAAGLSFMKLWDSINDARGFGWANNPWIVAYTFKVHKQNIDRLSA